MNMSMNERLHPCKIINQIANVQNNPINHCQIQINYSGMEREILQKPHKVWAIQITNQQNQDYKSALQIYANESIYFNSISGWSKTTDKRRETAV